MALDPIFRIETLPDASSLIKLSPPLLDAVGGPSGRVILAAGSIHLPVAVFPGAPEGVLAVAAGVLEQLRLPTEVPYRVKASGERLNIGPVIGILAGQAHRDLTPGRRRAASSHLLTASKGGLYCLLDREALLASHDGLVRSHYYVPGGEWRYGVLPLPAAVFCRFGVRLGAADRMPGPDVAVFNQRLFHKGEAWLWMASDPRVASHLPETAPLRDPGVLRRMLRRHRAVYIKPVWGSLARGVFRVSAREDGYEIASSDGQSEQYQTRTELVAAVNERATGQNIVQQAIELAQVDGRMTDFRVIVQRDGSGDWCVPGIVGRLGTAGLNVSNMATGGFPLPFAATARLLFGDNGVAQYQRWRELAGLAVAAAESLAAGSGLHLGDLGLDIAYDLGGKPWIIEANNRDPDHNIAWEAGDWPLFFRIRQLPMDYAEYLAGFGTAQPKGGQE